SKRTRTPPPAKPSRIDAVRELVGVLTDAEVAAKAGVTSSAVHQYRQRNGIAPALPQGTTRRSVERRRVADEAGAAGGTPQQRIQPHEGKLGKVADDVLARKAKVKGSEVRAYREKLGIPAYSTKRAAKAEGEGRRSKIDAFRHLVGVLTDPEVAVQAGVTRTAVQMYRKKHRIPPAAPPGDPTVARTRTPEAIAARAAVPPRPAPSGAGRQFAWKLTLASAGGELVRIAVAEDAASACSRAAAYGDVVSVERLAEALPGEPG
ncbi:MAG: hypothetical protein ABMA64_22230, partial [Myxococcota bacterium]